MDYQVTDSLKNISKWGKVLGYAFIILGALSAIGGIFAMVVGAIPGIIQIFLGLYLLRSAKQADVMLHQMNDEAMGELLLNYARFLKLNGILLIISFVLLAVGFLFMGGLFFSALNSM